VKKIVIFVIALIAAILLPYLIFVAHAGKQTKNKQVISARKQYQTKPINQKLQAKITFNLWKQLNGGKQVQKQFGNAFGQLNKQGITYFNDKVRAAGLVEQFAGLRI